MNQIADFCIFPPVFRLQFAVRSLRLTLIVDLVCMPVELTFRFFSRFLYEATTKETSKMSRKRQLKCYHESTAMHRKSFTLSTATDELIRGGELNTSWTSELRILEERKARL